MLGKRSRSVIGRLSELLAPGSRSGLLGSSPSPLDIFSRDRSGNDHAVARSNNSKNPNNRRRIFERGHGVGLAIVVALEKPSSSPPSSGSRGGGGTGFCSKYVVCSLGRYRRPDQDRAEEEEKEDYTYVTFHGPRESFTMVYYDQSELSKGGDRDGDGGRSHGEFLGLGLLSSCQLCGKKLHGQDIYIYGGEKGFCSAECRSGQIMVDERSEQCQSEAPRVGDACSYSAATYSESQIFSTSIIAI